MQINLTQKAVKYFDQIIYVPVWAKYLAVDSDGTLTAYEKEPQCCECLNGDGYWVLTEPGREIDICQDVDLEGMDFKETCVNIESEVDDELLNTMRTYLAGNILSVNDNPHDHTEWFEQMRKVDAQRVLLGEWKPTCGQQNKEGGKNAPLTKEEIDILQTDLLTLCKRIKDAYEEGLLDKQWNLEVQTDEQLWNSSKTKRIYDALIKLAMEQ